MKKLTALVTTLVLGVSSAALAAPGIRVGEPHPQAPSYERYRSWQPLTTTRLGTKVNVVANNRFSTLKLEATRGGMFIDKLIVTFANGRSQVIEVDQTLGYRRGGQSTVVDLQGNHRRITAIAVYGRGNARNAAVTVMGA